MTGTGGSQRSGAPWDRRESQRLLDALYTELATSLDSALLTTDARLARSDDQAELISDSG